MAAVPLALVTGFLGSGKTTSLEQAARRYSGSELVFILRGPSSELARRLVEGVKNGRFSRSIS